MQYPFYLFFILEVPLVLIMDGIESSQPSVCRDTYGEKKKIQFPHTHTHNVGKVKVLRWRRSLACCVSDSELRREISLWGDFLDWSTQPSSSVRCRAPWSGLQRRTHLWQNCRTKTDQFKQMFKSFSVIWHRSDVLHSFSDHITTFKMHKNRFLTSNVPFWLTACDRGNNLISGSHFVLLLHYISIY